MKKSFFLQTLVVTIVLVGSSELRAETQRVLLIHSGAGDPLTAHLVDELVAAGFTVEVVPAGNYESRTLARKRHARAVLRIEPSRHAIELWTDAKDGPVRIEEKNDEQGDWAMLSLRAVEELRGHLLTSVPAPRDHGPDEPSEPQERQTQPTPTVETKPIVSPLRPSEPLRPRALVESSKSAHRVWLHVAPAAILHPGSGGLSSGATVVLGARWMFLRYVGAELVTSFPIVPSTLASSVGNVNIAASAILLGAWVDLFRPVPALGFGIGAGAGGGVFHHYGQPQTSGIEARDGNVAYALPYARSALSWSITSNISLRADILAAVAAPRPVLRLPGRTSDAYFGQPLLTIGLGLDLKLK